LLRKYNYEDKKVNLGRGKGGIMPYGERKNKELKEQKGSKINIYNLIFQINRNDSLILKL